ncbi:GDP dissociation inhibitor [Powellomyces hirtus]|nr:GDP dissociation inhibitor [Powellomyces hirtus]
MTADKTHFDVIVLGTGLTESIVAGSLARAGKSVLHIDRNEFYGEHLASFDLINLLKVTNHGKEEDPFLSCYDEVELIFQSGGEEAKEAEMKEEVPKTNSVEATARDGGSDVEAKPDRKTELADFLRDYPDMDAVFKATCGIDVEDTVLSHLAKSTADGESEPWMPKSWALLELLRTSRQYNLELCPKLLYSRGGLVELLAKSGVGRYLEFKALDQIYLFWEGKVEQAPGSKEDVFGNQTVSLVDKRRLMKFLTFAMDYEENEGLFDAFKGKPYQSFLQDQKLSPRLIGFILNATALVVERETLVTLSTEEGLALTQRHLRSLGRWGKTAFLVALYGAGSELSQAFCRLCAVYGGTYILKYPLSHISISSESGPPVSVAADDGTVYTASWVVTSSTYAKYFDPEHKLEAESQTVWRGIAILDQPLYGQSTLNVTVFPPESIGNVQGVMATQQSWDVSSCPKTKYVVHFQASGPCCSREDIRKALVALTNDAPADAAKPTVLLAVLYRQTVRSCGTTWLNDSAVVCTPETATPDLEQAPTVARSIFDRIAPGEEFLPSVPDQSEDM